MATDRKGAVYANENCEKSIVDFLKSGILLVGLPGTSGSEMVRSGRTFVLGAFLYRMNRPASIFGGLLGNCSSKHYIVVEFISEDCDKK